MCLLIDIKKHADHSDTLPLVAKQDITVYKMIFTNNESLYTFFKYKPNTLYRLRKSLKIEYSQPLKQNVKKTVEEGFHAFTKENGFTGLNLPYKKLVKFTIPKGAKYYLGMNGDIVSTSIRSGNLKGIQ